MKLRMITEGIASTVGHAALDIAGFVPGYGEAADLTNAIWYTEQGDYLSAILSLVSMIPEVGDVIGKGAKYLSKSSSFTAKLLEKNGDIVVKYWPKVLKLVENSKKLKPYAKVFDQIIRRLPAYSTRSSSQVSQQQSV